MTDFMLTSDNVMRRVLDFSQPTATEQEREKVLRKRQSFFRHQPPEPVPGRDYLAPCRNGRACTSEKQAKNEGIKLSHTDSVLAAPVARPDRGTLWWLGDERL